jgi:hypothetical protein
MCISCLSVCLLWHKPHAFVAKTLMAHGACHHAPSSSLSFLKAISEIKCSFGPAIFCIPAEPHSATANMTSSALTLPQFLSIHGINPDCLEFQIIKKCLQFAAAMSVVS